MQSNLSFEPLVAKYKQMVAVGLPKGSVMNRMKLVDKVAPDIIEKLIPLVFGEDLGEKPEDTLIRMQKEQADSTLAKEEEYDEEDLSPCTGEDDPRFAKYFKMLRDGDGFEKVGAEMLKNKFNPDVSGIFYRYAYEHKIADWRPKRKPIKRKPVSYDDRPVGSSAVARMNFRPPKPGPPSKSAVVGPAWTDSARIVDDNNDNNVEIAESTANWLELESVQSTFSPSKLSSSLLNAPRDQIWKCEELPVWNTIEYTSCFCDVFSAKAIPPFTPQSSTESMLMKISTFLSDYKSPFSATTTGDNDFCVLRNVSSTIKRAACLESVLLTHAVKHSRLNHFDVLSKTTIPNLIEIIKTMPKSEQLVVPSGICGEIGDRQVFFFVIEREENEYALTIVNAGGYGFEYHPLAAEVPKIKAMTAARFNHISSTAITDSGWWLMIIRISLVPHTLHSIRQIYEALLPVLFKGKTTIEHLDCNHMDWTPYSTVPRSRYNCWKTCWSLAKYLLRRQGISKDKIRELSLSLRWSMMEQLHEDLTTYQPQLLSAEAEMIEYGTQQLSHDVLRWTALKDAKKMTSDLRNIQSLIQSISELVASKIGKKNITLEIFDIGKSGLSCITPTVTSHFEISETEKEFKEKTSGLSLTYSVEQESTYVSNLCDTENITDLSDIIILVESCDGLLRLLNARLIEEFKQQAGEADVLSITALMILPRICAMVELLFIDVLSVPRWNDPDDVWRQGNITIDEHFNLMLQLRYISTVYLHASRTMRWSMKRWADGRRVITLSVLAAVADSLMRHSVSPLHHALRGVPVSVCHFSGSSLAETTKEILLAPAFAFCRGQVLEYFHQQKLHCHGLKHNIKENEEEKEAVKKNPELVNINVPAPPPSPPEVKVTTVSDIRRSVVIGKGKVKDAALETKDEGLFDFRRVGGLYLAPDTTLIFMCQLKPKKKKKQAEAEKEASDVVRSVWDEKSSFSEVKYVELNQNAKVKVERGLRLLCSEWESIPILPCFRDILLLSISAVAPEIEDTENVPLLEDGSVGFKPQWLFIAKKYAKEGKLKVKMFGESLAERQVQRENLPVSSAAPWSFLKGYAKKSLTEGTILHIPTLSNFMPGLSEEEAEYLLTILATPTNRIPLLTSFFAEDYASILFEQRSQNIFEGAFFEPWLFGSLIVGEDREKFKEVPCVDPNSRRTLLSTPFGLLLEELKMAPQATLDGVYKIADHVARIGVRFSGLDSASSVVRTVLFVTRILVAVQSGAHIAKMTNSSQIPVDYLNDWNDRAQNLLNIQILPLLQEWVKRAIELGDSPTLVQLHAHIALAYTHFSSSSKFEQHDVCLYFSSLSYALMWSRGKSGLCLPLVDVLNGFFTHCWQPVKMWFESADKESIDIILSKISDEVMARSKGEMSTWTRQNTSWNYSNAERTLTINIDTGEVRVLDSPLADVPKYILNHIDYKRCFPNGTVPTHCNIVTNQRDLRLQLYDGGFVYDLVQLKDDDEVKPNLIGFDFEGERRVNGHKWSTQTCCEKWMTEFLDSLAEEFKPKPCFTVFEKRKQSSGLVVWRYNASSDEKKQEWRELVFIKNVNKILVYVLRRDMLSGYIVRELVSSNEGLAFTDQPDKRLLITRILPKTSRKDCYLPPDSLKNTIPSVLIDQFSWWIIGDTKIIEGLPLKPESQWFHYSLNINTKSSEWLIERKDSDGNRYMLLDWTQAAEGSLLASFGVILSRLDSITNTLAWGVVDDKGKTTLSHIELPRIQLTFRPSLDSTKRLRLFTDELAGWCLAETHEHHSALVNSLPRCVLLEEASSSLFSLIVPTFDLIQNEEEIKPFSMPFSFTFKSNIVRNRVARPPTASTYHQFGIHVTQLILNSPTLSSALYLFLLRLLNRQYEDAFRAADACASESPYSDEERWLMNQLVLVQKMDSHPDAIACRLKLAAVGALYSGIERDLWDVYGDVVAYTRCLSHVSEACKLSRDHEYIVLHRALQRKQATHQKFRCEHTNPVSEPREFDEWLLASRMHFVDPSYKLLPISPWHGGGGFRRFEQDLPAIFEKYWESYEPPPGQQGGSPWIGDLPVPKHPPGSVLVDTAVEDVIEHYEDITSHWLQLYDIISGATECKINESGNVGYTIASILIRMYYLKDQKYQNFPQFQKQAYHYLAGILHMNRLPPAPHRGRPFKSIELPQFGTSIGGQFLETLTVHIKKMALSDEWKPKSHHPSVNIPSILRQTDCTYEHKVLDASCVERKLSAFSLDGNNELLTNEDLEAFSFRPLGLLSFDQYLSTVSPHKSDKTTSHFPFDLDSASQSKLAQDLLDRQKHDYAVYIEQEGRRTRTVLKNLAIDRLLQLVSKKTEIITWPENIQLARALNDLTAIQTILVKAAEEEQTFLATQGYFILGEALKLSSTNENDEKAAEKILYSLRLTSRTVPKMRLEHILLSTVSNSGESDLLLLNPYLTNPQLFVYSGICFALHASRLSQIVRTLSFCSEACVLLEHLIQLTQHTSLFKDISDSIEALDRVVTPFLANLTAHRNYFVKSDGDGQYTFDPRFLLFEFLSGFVLKKRQVQLVNDFVSAVYSNSSTVHQMIMGEGKTTVITPLLFLMLANSKRLVTEVMPQSLVPMAVNIARSVFSSILPRPVFCLEFGRSSIFGTPEQTLKESTQLAVRIAQIQGQQGVVVSSSTSIKSIFLKYLELLRDPNPEYDASANQLGKIMSIWRSGVLLLDEIDLLLSPLKSELNFPIGIKTAIDLSPERWELPLTLIDAFLCPPEDWSFLDSEEREIMDGIHSLIEDGLNDRFLQKTPHLLFNEKSVFQNFTNLAVQLACKWLDRTCHIFHGGFSPVDDSKVKVTSDSVYSPKKNIQYDAHCVLEDRAINDEWKRESYWCSEEYPKTATLNFDVSNCMQTIGGLDILYKTLSEFFGFSGQSMMPDSIVIEAGGKNGKFKHVLTSMHCVDGRIVFDKPISDVKIIRIRLKGISRWFGIRRIKLISPEPTPLATANDVRSFLSTAHGQETNRTTLIFNSFPKRSQQILNLTRDIIWSYLPHCFFKVNRVQYGLLQELDELSLGSSADDQPITRRLLAVPFVGKDSPSPASEFSHPDIAIALTYLAYRYEGLRQSDLRIVIDTLKFQLKTEPGPATQRPTFKMFNEWFGKAQNRLGSALNILPLDLLDPNDDAQMKEIAVWMCKSPEICRYYVTTYVYPKTMQPRQIKLSCSGQDLGNDMLFGHRLGFSGTPSNLLPLEMGECRYESGSEGKIVATLTSTQYVTTEIVYEWSVKSLLLKIAKENYHALIDTGALITGMSNREVAQFLLSHGLVGLQACVYIDEATRTPMALFRGSEISLPLKRCSLSDSMRFTFYDHVSTTGVDIRQCIRARAAMTLSKDMTLRDYAQGAWRMRGLGGGQTLHVYIISQLLGKIQNVGNEDNPMIVNIVAWLLSNTIKSEHIQFIQLSTQNLGTIWRVAVFENLLFRSLTNIGEDTTTLSRRKKMEDSWYAHCVKLYEQQMNYSVALGLEPRKDEEELHVVAKKYSEFITTPSQRLALERVEGMVDMSHVKKEKEEPQQRQRSSFLCSVASTLCGRTFCMRSPFEEIDIRAMEAVELDCEVVQEKEREQEQEQDFEDEKPVRLFVGKSLDPTPWGLSILSSKNQWQGSPFYPISEFRTQNWDIPLDTSVKNVGLSLNHTSLEYNEKQPRRLTNLFIVLEIQSANQRAGRENPANQKSSNIIAISLAEADSLRRQIGRKLPPFDSDRSPPIRLLRLRDGQTLAISQTYTNANTSILPALSLLRFYNCDLWISPAEVKCLQSTLKKVDVTDRLRFFRSVLLGRRRDNTDWSDTPVEGVIGGGS